MRIQNLYLKNFRRFKELSIDFQPDYTILIGNNGSGKSSILNALRIMLQTFAFNFQHDLRTSKPDYFAGYAIQEPDARLESSNNGSIIVQTPQYPVIITASAIFQNDENFSWSYELQSHLSRKSENVNYVLNCIQDIQQKITADEDVIAPIIVHYGTHRQWNNTELNNDKEITFIPQMNGYLHCLDSKTFNINIMRNWFARMLLISRKKTVSEFEAVKRAISQCYMAINDQQNIKTVAIDYDAEREDIEIQLYFDNDNFECLPLNYLSDGNKSVLGIVADIAYRMAVLNPHLLDKAITETYGIVLIDEIDLHLHPSWQRKIISALHSTFPKVQFIVTTHSPTVITNVPQENIRILDSGQIFKPTTKTYGRDVNSILREIMKTDIRPSAISSQFQDFSDAIAEGDLGKAETTLDSLRKIIGDNDPEIISSQVTLDLEKI